VSNLCGPQASSSKPQATSDKLLTNKDYRIIKDI